MDELLRDQKIKALEDRKEKLFEDLSAANDQLNVVLDASQRIRIGRQIKGIEGQIEQVVDELRGLKAAVPVAPQGDSWHIMCDRSPQMAQFKSFFVPNHHFRPGLPHVYIVHGDKGQCHRSFVKRLELEKIRPFAEATKGTQFGAVKTLKVNPEFGNGLLDFQRDAQFGLFEEVSMNYDPARMSASDLREHGELKRFSHVIIEHRWEVSEPSAWLQEAVRWYLETYWRTVAADAAKPQMLIFLNFVYLNSGAPLLRYVLPSNNPVKERFRNFLAELHAHINRFYPCLLFDELGYPMQKDLCESLNEIGVHDEDDCPEWLKKLYKKRRGKVTMAEIERRLKEPKLGPHADSPKWWRSGR